MAGIIDGKLNVVIGFAAPLTVASNVPAFATDTLSLSTIRTRLSAQRWEVTTNLVPTNSESTQFWQTVVHDCDKDFYIKGFQPYIKNERPFKGQLELNNAPYAGDTSMQAFCILRESEQGGTLPKGTLINIGRSDKVYMLTEDANFFNDGDNNYISIFPAYVGTYNEGTGEDKQVWYGDDCYMNVLYDPSSVKGMSYTDGILMDLGSVKLLEYTPSLCNKFVRPRDIRDVFDLDKYEPSVDPDQKMTLDKYLGEVYNGNWLGDVTTGAQTFAKINNLESIDFMVESDPTHSWLMKRVQNFDLDNDYYDSVPFAFELDEPFMHRDRVFLNDTISFAITRVTQVANQANPRYLSAPVPVVNPVPVLTITGYAYTLTIHDRLDAWDILSGVRDTGTLIFKTLSSGLYVDSTYLGTSSFLQTGLFYKNELFDSSRPYDHSQWFVKWDDILSIEAAAIRPTSAEATWHRPFDSSESSSSNYVKASEVLDFALSTKVGTRIYLDLNDRISAVENMSTSGFTVRNNETLRSLPQVPPVETNVYPLFGHPITLDMSESVVFSDRMSGLILLNTVDVTKDSKFSTPITIGRIHSVYAPLDVSFSSPVLEHNWISDSQPMELIKMPRDANWSDQYPSDFYKFVIDVTWAFSEPVNYDLDKVSHNNAGAFTVWDVTGDEDSPVKVNPRLKVMRVKNDGAPYLSITLDGNTVIERGKYDSLDTDSMHSIKLTMLAIDNDTGGWDMTVAVQFDGINLGMYETDDMSRMLGIELEGMDIGIKRFNTVVPREYQSVSWNNSTGECYISGGD